MEITLFFFSCGMLLIFLLLCFKHWFFGFLGGTAGLFVGIQLFNDNTLTDSATGYSGDPLPFGWFLVFLIIANMLFVIVKAKGKG